MHLFSGVRYRLVTVYDHYRSHSVVLLLEIAEENPKHHCRLHEAEADTLFTYCKLDSGLNEWLGYDEGGWHLLVLLE